MSAVTLRATLRTDARVTTEGAQRAALHLVLRVDGCGTGVQATLPYLCVGAGWLAHRSAERLRAGREVTVWCAGFGQDADGRLRLFGVDHVTCCDGVPA
jgi:hypothetical protein